MQFLILFLCLVLLGCGAGVEDSQSSGSSSSSEFYSSSSTKSTELPRTVESRKVELGYWIDTIRHLDVDLMKAQSQINDSLARLNGFDLIYESGALSPLDSGERPSTVGCDVTGKISIGAINTDLDLLREWKRLGKDCPTQITLRQEALYFLRSPHGTLALLHIRTFDESLNEIVADAKYFTHLDTAQTTTGTP